MRKSLSIFNQLKKTATSSLLKKTPKYFSTTTLQNDQNTWKYRYKNGKIRVTLFEGHGIGPEISDAVCQIFEEAGANIHWDKMDIGIPIAGSKKLISDESLNSVLDNQLALKGPLATPIGKGYRSLNITLRKELELYANVRPAKSIPAIKTLFDGVDIVTIRENTEGEYSGLEHEVTDGVIESLKVITKKSSDRIARYAFKYAKEHNRKKVTAIHKATVMKMSDGLFLNSCRDTAANFPEIEYEEAIVDAITMKLVQHPEKVDVLVTTNLYGDIVSDLCAGLIGGLGLTPSGNYGNKASLFEAVHGTAPDIAGKNLANPTALLLSGLMMLRHIEKTDIADRIESSIFNVFKEGKVLTGDLGGKATTTEFTQAILKGMK